MPQVKLIAHRGNTSGPNPSEENRPSYLLKAINLGFDVEVDVWLVDGEFYLGHDEPDYPVDEFYLSWLRDSAWFHCKNLDALKFFTESNLNYRYFWHQVDDYTLTSTGHIWTYPNREYSKDSIIVDLRPNYDYKYGEVYAVCVDYIGGNG